MADQQQVCPHCGHFNRLGARYCAKCAYDFKPQSAANQAAQAAAPQQEAAQSTAPNTAPANASAPITQVAADASAAVVESRSGSTDREYCPSCGKEVTPGVRFCRHCGQDLSTAAIAIAAGAAAPAADGAAPASQPSAAASAVADSQTLPFNRAGRAAPAAVPIAAPAVTLPPVQRTGAWWLTALSGLLLGLVLGAVIGAGMVMALPGLVGLQHNTSDSGMPPAESTAATPAPKDDQAAVPAIPSATMSAAATDMPATGMAATATPPADAPAATVPVIEPLAAEPTSAEPAAAIPPIAEPNAGLAVTEVLTTSLDVTVTPVVVP